MKTFKQFLRESKENFRFFDDFTSTDIDKVFKLYDKFTSKIIFEPYNNRTYKRPPSRIQDVPQRNDSSYVQLDQGLKIKILDVNSTHWDTEVLFKLAEPTGNENGRTYHHNGNEQIRKNFDGYVFFVKVGSEKKQRRGGEEPYVLPEDDETITPGSFIGHTIFGAFSSNEAAKNIVVDKSLETKHFFGNINAGKMHLDSLEGFPREITGWVYVYNNNLKTLHGSPRKIHNSFSSQSNSFSASSNPITSLEGAPEYIESGASFSDCAQLRSIAGIHKIIKHATSLDFSGCPIKSGVLGLLEIQGLSKVKLADDRNKVENYDELVRVEEIVNKHLKVSDTLECQDELIDAGLEEYAKL